MPNLYAHLSGSLSAILDKALHGEPLNRKLRDEIRRGFQAYAVGGRDEFRQST